MKKPPLTVALTCVMILSVVVYAGAALQIYMQAPMIETLADMASTADDNRQLAWLMAGWHMKALLAAFTFARIWFRRSYMTARIFVMYLFAASSATFALDWEGPNLAALVQLVMSAAFALLFFWLSPKKLGKHDMPVH